MLKPLSCQGCPLYFLGEGFSQPEGQGTSGVAIIGEALGYEERIDGLPFRPRAQAGSKLEEVFRLVSNETLRPISRNNFLVYNVINCRPPGNELRGSSYEVGAIEHCRQNHLLPIMDKFRNSNNRVILALGNTPLTALTGFTGIADEKQSIYHLRGFVFKTQYGLVIPSFHPSFVKRGNNHLTPIVVEDMIRALGVASGEFISYYDHKDYKLPQYQMTPSLDEARSFYYRCKDSFKLPIYYDIETQDSAFVDEDERDDLENTDIELFQFSLNYREGIAFPFQGEYINIIKSILSLPNVKAGHNVYNFDNPIIKSKEIKIEGRIHDTMWMFKHWHSRLPRGIQNVASMLGFPFPWKHLYSSNLPFYGCADVDAGQLILRTLPPLMKARGVWEGYVNHVVRLYSPTLERARDIGIPVNEEKRLELKKNFEEKRKEIDKELQEKIPDELRNITPKRKVLNDKNETIGYDYGYIREPKTIENENVHYSELIGKLSPEKSPVSFETYLYRKHNLVFAEFKSEFKNDDGSDRIGRWCKLLPFKASSKQLIGYLRHKQKECRQKAQKIVEFCERTGRISRRKVRHGGIGDVIVIDDKKLNEKRKELLQLAEEYEVPLKLKTKKETTGGKELEEIYFKTGDEVIELVLKIRSIDYNLNTQIPNWKPKPDGKVHTTWGFVAPTGQLDSRKPNILNCSKHTEYGQEFRGIIEAPRGYVFVEADKKSFHVAMMGYVANDKDYIKFSQTDPHSIFGSYIDPSILGKSIEMSWSENDILLAAKDFKRRCKLAREKDPLHGVDIRQSLAKPTVLGNQLGLGPVKLQRQNRRYIHTIEQAKRLQGIIADLFPKVARFKDQIREKAFNQKYLMNEFGFIQWFYDVFSFSWNKRTNGWNRHAGDDSEKCLGFVVQSPAFGMIQEEILEMERLGINEHFNFLNTIHDSVVCMPREEEIEECIIQMGNVMNQPCKKLVNEATGPEGLLVKVEFSVGRNWKSYDKNKNPFGMREVN